MCLEEKITAFISFNRKQNNVTKMKKRFGTQCSDHETENSHSRASGIGKTCSGFDLIKRKRWLTAVKLRPEVASPLCQRQITLT